MNIVQDFLSKKVMTLMDKTLESSCSNAKGSATDKLSQLHNIRHRRFLEPQDSPNCTEDVCNQIPETLDDENLEAIGYHQGCY